MFLALHAELLLTVMWFAACLRSGGCDVLVLHQGKWIKAMMLITVVGGENPCIKKCYRPRGFRILPRCWCSLGSQRCCHTSHILKFEWICQSRLINACQFYLLMKVCRSLSNVNYLTKFIQGLQTYTSVSLLSVWWKLVHSAFKSK